MPSRRDKIRMTDDELTRFVAEQKIVSCATNGPSGRPHLVPLWYVPDGIELRGWTYGASQKARNLERDPRASLQVEAGEEYHLLRGVLLECDVVVHRDIETVAGIGLEIFRRYAAGPGGELAPEVEAMVRAQAPKRVGLQFVERRRATWDHRKLGAGVY